MRIAGNEYLTVVFAQFNESVLQVMNFIGEIADFFCRHGGDAREITLKARADVSSLRVAKHLHQDAEFDSIGVRFDLFGFEGHRLKLPSELAFQLLRGGVLDFCGENDGLTDLAHPSRRIRSEGDSWPHRLFGKAGGLRKGGNRECPKKGADPCRGRFLSSGIGQKISIFMIRHIAIKQLIKKHEGKVPDSFEELEKLPGVGHKTASVVMSQGFGHPAFPVDTHIHRLAQRWGLTNGKN